MKKIACIVLVLAMVLGLCACEIGGSTPSLKVGYSKQCISPTKGVSLSGYANDADRISTEVLYDVYVTCIAFQEGEDTVLMFSQDSQGMGTEVAKAVRSQITMATGVPQKRIMFGDTHSHSSPTISNNADYVDFFNTVYLPAVLAAAKEAIADLSPATLHGTKVQTEAMNYVRHYIVANGTIAGSNFGDYILEHKEHLRDGDREMVLIKAERKAKDKQDILLMNWACHPTLTGGGSSSTIVTADYVGTCRDAIEAETDMLFMFYQGGGGDEVATSQVPSLKRDPAWTIETYGQALAKYAIDALPTMEKIEGEGIKTEQYVGEFATNKYRQDLLKEAQLVIERYNEVGSVEAKAYGRTLGIYNGHTEARGIINCSKTGLYTDMELDALYIGGMAFVTAPWEMFSDTAIYIKENSPFKYTVVISLGNGKSSYLPTKEAFEYGCYESFNSTYGAGVAEEAAEKLVSMLKGFQ